MDLQPAPIFFEPCPDSRILVVRSIVLNEMCSLRVILAGQLIEKNQVGRGIEYFVSVVGKLCGEYFNRAKDLDAFPLSSDRNLRLTPNRSPRLIQRGILAETGFVLKDQRGPFTCGFFLDSDKCSGAICLALPGLPSPASVSASAPKNRSRAEASAHVLDDNGSQIRRQ